MVLSGFVEFSVAFILLGAVSVAGRVVARVFQAIFLLAISSLESSTRSVIDDHCNLVCALHARTDERARDSGVARKIRRDGNVFLMGYIFWPS